jgi:hypothetical protein
MEVDNGARLECSQAIPVVRALDTVLANIPPYGAKETSFLVQRIRFIATGMCLRTHVLPFLVCWGPHSLAVF